MRAQRDQRGVGHGTIALLERSLDGAQLFGVHDGLPSATRVNRSADRACARAASCSRVLGGAFVSSDLSSWSEAAAIASMASLKACSLAFDGLLKPLTLRTNC